MNRTFLDTSAARIFFLALFLALLYQFYRIFSPFLEPALWAGVFCLVFYSMHRRFLKICQGLPQREALASLASTGVIVAVIVVPLIFILWSLAQEAAALYPVAHQWLIKARAEGFSRDILPQSLLPYLERLKNLLGPLDADLQQSFLKLLGKLSQAAASLGAQTAKNLLGALFNLLVFVLSLFFLFKEGPGWVQETVGLLPMEERHKQAILRRLEETLLAVIRGLLVTAAVQGLLAWAGYWISGVPFPVFFGFLTAFMALIPFLGAAAVWAPLAAFLFLKGEPGMGLFLALWGFFAVSLVDNFMKPVLIGSGAKLPFVLLFFGILGGLKAYGISGILLGPVLIACALAFVKIYREEFKQS